MYPKLDIDEGVAATDDRDMSDHALLGWLIVLVIVMEVGAFLVTVPMLRESQRLTRAVAALVYQESEQPRSIITGRSRLDDG